MEIKDTKGWSKCDSGHVFKSNEVELKPFGDGISITPPPGMSMVFADDSGNINTGIPEATDQILHCPVCHKPQLFGFDAAEPEKASIPMNLYEVTFFVNAKFKDDKDVAEFVSEAESQIQSLFSNEKWLHGDDRKESIRSVRVKINQDGM